MCAEKTRRLEVSRDEGFSPRVQNSGGKLASLPVLALPRRPRHFFGPSVARSCHLSAAIRWWSRTSSTPISVFCNANTPTPGFPTPKGMAAVCNLALVDPLLKNITPTLQSLAPLHSAVTANIPTPDEVVERQYAPLQLRHTIAHLLSPHQKCVFYGRVGKSLRKTVLGPGFNFLQYRAGRPPKLAPLNSFSPHSYANCPHQCTIFQQSLWPALWPIGSLPGAF